MALQDEITRFLPDYPARGRKITVEHLLTHTSGIQSYTDMAEWLPLWRKDFTVKELVDLFKDKPMRFEPGERWEYNNSGYVLFGAIIEKVSGRTYEEFVDARIFKPLGMKSSYYGRTERIIPRRIPGYQMGSGGFINAPYISMTQPYAAGSLLSSVDDLALWSEAVFSGKLVKKEWLVKALTPFKLKNGESSGYGYGWFIADFAGHRSVEHGGGINGFTTHEMTFPEDGLFVSILTNSAVEGRDPEPRAVEIAWLALGLSKPEPKPVTLSRGDLDPLPGVYEDAAMSEYHLSLDGTTLVAQRKGGGKQSLAAVSPTEFIFRDRPARLVVVKDAKGAVTGLRIESRIGPAQVFAKTGRPLPSPRKESTVDPKVYDLYAGEYELNPGFSITIFRRGDRLISRATGQPDVMFGGADPAVPDLVPSDIEFRHNHCFKPLSWKIGHSSYAGIPWTVKNLFELKNARRVLLEGNLFENNWAHAQSGTAILFTVRNQDGKAPWSAVQDVTMINNVVRNSPTAFVVMGEDHPNPSQQSQRFLIRNNLFEQIENTAFMITSAADDVEIDHNTFVPNNYSSFCMTGLAGHDGFRLSRHAMISSSARIASSTGTTGRTWNSNDGSMVHYWWISNWSSQFTNMYPPQSPTRMTNISILKWSGYFHWLNTSRMRFWAFVLGRRAL